MQSVPLADLKCLTCESPKATNCVWKYCSLDAGECLVPVCDTECGVLVRKKIGDKIICIGCQEICLTEKAIVDVSLMGGYSICQFTCSEDCSKISHLMYSDGVCMVCQNKCQGADKFFIYYLDLSRQQKVLCLCGPNCQTKALAKIPDKLRCPVCALKFSKNKGQYDQVKSISENSKYFACSKECMNNLRKTMEVYANLPKCNFCAIQRGVKFACSSCKSVVYCSDKCQKLDWAEHKTRCKNLVVSKAVTKVKDLLKGKPLTQDVIDELTKDMDTEEVVRMKKLAQDVVQGMFNETPPPSVEITEEIVKEVNDSKGVVQNSVVDKITKVVVQDSVVDKITKVVEDIDHKLEKINELIATNNEQRLANEPERCWACKTEYHAQSNDKYSFHYLTTKNIKKHAMYCSVKCKAKLMRTLPNHLRCVLCAVKYYKKEACDYYIDAKDGGSEYLTCSHKCCDDMAQMISETIKPLCRGCFKAEATFGCSVCKIEKYCSAACQKVAWPSHKTSCQVRVQVNSLQERSSNMTTTNSLIENPVAALINSEYRTNTCTGEKFHMDDLTPIELLIFQDWSQINCSTCPQKAGTAQRFNDARGYPIFRAFCNKCTIEYVKSLCQRSPEHDSAICEVCFKTYSQEKPRWTVLMRKTLTVTQHICSHECANTIKTRYDAALVKAGVTDIEVTAIG